MSALGRIPVEEARAEVSDGRGARLCVSRIGDRRLRYEHRAGGTGDEGAADCLGGRTRGGEGQTHGRGEASRGGGGPAIAPEVALRLGHATGRGSLGIGRHPPDARAAGRPEARSRRGRPARLRVALPASARFDRPDDLPGPWHAMGEAQSRWVALRLYGAERGAERAGGEFVDRAEAAGRRLGAAVAPDRPVPGRGEPELHAFVRLQPRRQAVQLRGPRRRGVGPGMLEGPGLRVGDRPSCVHARRSRGDAPPRGIRPYRRPSGRGPQPAEGRARVRIEDLATRRRQGTPRHPLIGPANRGTEQPRVQPRWSPPRGPDVPGRSRRTPGVRGRSPGLGGRDGPGTPPIRDPTGIVRPRVQPGRSTTGGNRRGAVPSAPGRRLGEGGPQAREGPGRPVPDRVRLQPRRLTPGRGIGG